MHSALALLFIIFISVSTSEAQSLLNQRIRKLTTTKQSVYFDNGIFHNGSNKKPSKIKAIRHSFSSTKGFERVVFDFMTKKIPKLYGHVSKTDHKVYLDFFETKIPDGISSFGNTKYVKAVNFFPISKDSLSVEIVLKDQVGADIFYLENPGRLVIDLKK